MNFRLLTNKRPRLFHTSLRYNEQNFRANHCSLRLSSTIRHRFCNKTSFTPQLLYQDKSRSLFHHPIAFSYARSKSSFPPSRHYKPPQRVLKQMIAFSGAALTFFFFKPMLMFIINGAVAFGTYKLLRRLLDNLFPTIDIGRQRIFGFIPTNTQSNIDKLYYKSVDQIKSANLTNLSDDFRFSNPHSISSKSVAFGSTGHKETIFSIGYFGFHNDVKALVKVEGILMRDDDIMVKNIEMYFPNGEIIHIPIGQQKPPIIEAEFRDIE
ncbi:4870_t:CDS:2 [Funneliformis geosporum]|uniref:11153_t:CDS:1 n=1 Tax=Funneliformis geosporum TaxID=1117311 RepID=A0A9W4SKV0_9GLOM|nr:4870_t:CDS:2 [Funneliformis geosporum]CAI2172796.1 11153_t:CDS:2 [Funneliformis geosporum]